MKNKTNYVIILIVFFIGVLLAFSALVLQIEPAMASSVHSVVQAVSLTPPGNFTQTEDKCYVPADQKVVEWKSTYAERCRISLDGFCVWPIPHKHMTYKVTVTEGIPLRDRFGKVIASTNGDKRTDWATYDSTTWNSLPNSPFRRNRFTDFEPIASNEYVVMVQTRYRWFNNVDSTLGICMQQP
jgi:hypothetical protein